MYHDSLKGPSARRARTRSASSSSSRRLVSVATYRVSAGTRRVPPLSKPKSALRTATPRSRSVSRALDPSAHFVQRYPTVARVSRSRDRAASRPHRRASRPRRPPPISPIRAMMAFRSRKRKAGAARETQAEKPLVDAAASISTGSPTKHPVAAFANTVYVDPVIKVRRRARSRPRIARAIGSARLSRSSPRQTRIEITRHPKVGFALTPATHPTSPDFHTIRACIDTWIRRLS